MSFSTLAPISPSLASVNASIFNEFTDFSGFGFVMLQHHSTASRRDGVFPIQPRSPRETSVGYW